MNNPTHYCGINPHKEKDETMERITFQIGTTGYTFYRKVLADRVEFYAWASEDDAEPELTVTKDTVTSCLPLDVSEKLQSIAADVAGFAWCRPYDGHEDIDLEHMAMNGH